MITGILLTFQHQCFVYLQSVSLNSSLNGNQDVHPGENVVFQCTTWGSSIQAWSSDEYIRDRLEFVAVQYAGTTISSGFATAELIDTYVDNGQQVIISELRIIIQRSVLNSSVTCYNVGRDLSALISFQLSRKL